MKRDAYARRHVAAAIHDYRRMRREGASRSRAARLAAVRAWQESGLHTFTRWRAVILEAT